MMDVQQISIHGHRVAYHQSGSGPVILLIHGMAGSMATWEHVVPVLAQRFTVLVPDLPGHGESEKLVGDFSLGAFATNLRDLLVALDHERVTVVGQSLGGGVAMQLAYQYPERCERLVLVGSGGLGREVNQLLKLLSLPGSEAVLQLVCAAPIREVISTIAELGAKLGLSTNPALKEFWRSYDSLGDDETRRAFVSTLRAVINPGGQAVSAANRLHLAAEIPTLIVWGDADPIIPLSHAYAAHEAIEGSRLEIFPDVGHYPHCEDPNRFNEVLTDFIETTIPAHITVSRRHLMGPAETRVEA